MKKQPIFLLLLCVSFAMRLFGQAGKLDSSFNNTGVFSPSIEQGQDVVQKILVRPDGRVIELGVTYRAEQGLEFAIVQLLNNGVKDPSFGDGGIVLTNLPSTDFIRIQDAALQADGKFTALAIVYDSFGGYHDFLMRWTAIGRPDSTLDNDGMYEINFALQGLYTSCSGMAVQPDGKIIVCGGGDKYPGDESGLFLCRLLPEGLLDSSFGTGGYLITSYDLDYPQGQKVIIQTDGKILVGGLYNPQATGPHLLLARFLPDGLVDSVFGSYGVNASYTFGEVVNLLQLNDGTLALGGVNYSSFSSLLFFDPEGQGYWYNVLYDFTMNNLAKTPDGKIDVVGLGNWQIGQGVKVFRLFADGTPDYDFGQDGLVNVPLNVGYYSYCDLALSPNGNILVAGSSPPPTDMGLMRLNADGSADLTFGTQGIQFINVGISKETSVAVLTDSLGTITTGGEFADFTEPNGFLYRAKANGQTDDSFGAGGLLIPGEHFVVRAICTQSDGEILTLNGGSKEILLYRYHNDGSIDSLFGNFGVGYYYNYYYDLANISLSSIITTPDDKIWVMGSANDYNDYYAADILLMRFLPNGLPDSTFSEDGIAVFDPGLDNYFVRSGLIQADGKLVVTGYYPTGTNGKRAFVYRFDANGNPDATFGADGKATVASQNYSGNAVVQQADGKLVIVGSSLVGANQKILLVRFKTNGAKDLSFSGDGLAFLNFDVFDEGTSLAIQPDGKLLFGGWTAPFSSSGVANPLVGRLLTDGTPDTTFGQSGMAATELPGHNGLQALSLQTDGRLVGAGFSDDDLLLIRYLTTLDVGVVDLPRQVVALDVYPNPVQAMIQLRFELSQPGEVRIALVNQAGQVSAVFSEQQPFEAGTHERSFHVPADLPSGVYILLLEGNGWRKAVQVFVE